MVPRSCRFASSFLAIGRCCGPDSVVRKFSRKLGFCLPKLPRKRLPLPGFDACGRIIFGLLSHVTTDDKHASVMRNVSLPTLAPLLRTLPLQEMPRHLDVWLAAGLYDKVSVLIGLGDNTHCNSPHDCVKAMRLQLNMLARGLLLLETIP